ncbi:MAG TPA: type II toxin-antitoxin system VapC family toxin [Candidatus Binatia bacterium]|nr:type II toxin-antitoxin system VapC family toxin [Candidatus Binatia bacterium]
MTIVDINVLLDVLLLGAEHGDESERRLAAALRAGPVIVNDVIAAELAPIFDSAAALWSTLRDAEIELVPYPREAIFVAGKAFRRYRRRGGRRNRILPDFMIGAHAVASGARLLTRDGRFYRDSFPGLRLA